MLGRGTWCAPKVAHGRGIYIEKVRVSAFFSRIEGLRPSPQMGAGRDPAARITSPPAPLLKLSGLVNPYSLACAASPVLYTESRDGREQGHAPVARYLRSVGSAGSGATGICGIEFGRRCAPARTTGRSQPESQYRNSGECGFVFQARIWLACVLEERRRLRRAAAHSVDPARRHHDKRHAVSRAPTFAAGPVDGFWIRERGSFPVHGEGRSECQAWFRRSTRKG